MKTATLVKLAILVAVATTGITSFGVLYYKYQQIKKNCYEREYDLSIMLARAIRDRDSLLTLPPVKPVTNIVERIITRINTRRDTLVQTQMITVEGDLPYMFVRGVEVRDGKMKIAIGIGNQIRIFEYPYLNQPPSNISGTFDTTSYTPIISHKRLFFPMSVGIGIATKFDPVITLAPVGLARPLNLRANVLLSKNGLYGGVGIIPFPTKSTLVVGAALPIVEWKNTNTNMMFYLSSPFLKQ